jgi:hypothetical protein
MSSTDAFVEEEAGLVKQMSFAAEEATNVRYRINDSRNEGKEGVCG